MFRERRETRIWYRERPRVALLLLATVLACVVRFLSLGDHPLWIDEYITWSYLHPLHGSGFWEQFRDVFQSPLTIATLWPLSRGLCSEWLLRLPSALMGIAAVPVGGFLGAAVGGRRTGEWTLLLLALNPFLIWYSQEARGYAAVVLLSLCATLVLVKMLRDGPHIAAAIAYGLFAGAATMANNSALFYIAAQALTVLLTAPWRRRHDWGLWSISFGLALLLPAYWLLRAAGVLAVDRLAVGASTGAALRAGTTFSPLAWPFAFQSFFYGFSLGPSLTQLHQPDRLRAVMQAAPILIPALLAAVVLVVGGLGRLRRGTVVVLLMWIMIPLLAVSLLAIRNVKTFNPRYLAVCAPLVVIVAAHGAAKSRSGRWSVLVLIGFVLVSLGGYFGAERYAREDLRAPAVTIAAAADSGDGILVPVVSRLFAFYYHGQGMIKGFWDCPMIKTREDALAALRSRLRDTPRAWLVLCRSWELDPYHRLPDALAELGEITNRFEAPGVVVLAWRSRDSAGLSTPEIDVE